MMPLAALFNVTSSQFRDGEVERVNVTAPCIDIDKCRLVKQPC